MDVEPDNESSARDTDTFEVPAEELTRDPLEGVMLDRRFRLDRLIDRGGFGGVYEGVDLKFDSPVAVKVLFPEKAADARAFRREAKLARRFKHPNVVEVYDYGIDQGLSYIVMEFLRGPRLDQIFQQSGRQLPVPVFVKFVQEITSALQNAHEQQLVHRDLKPANIKLVDQGRAGERFVLLDLGIASQTSDTSTTLRNASRDFSFSPVYAAPEQYIGDSVTSLADIYSFGTILYELLVGRPPFTDRKLMALMQAITAAPPPPFAEVAPEREVSAEVEAVVRRCLEKTPAGRPQSMAEVRDSLLAAMNYSHAELFRTTEDGVLFITDGSAPPSGSTTLLVGSAATDETLRSPLSQTVPVPLTTEAASVPRRKAVVWSLGAALLAVLLAGGYAAGLFASKLVRIVGPPTIAVAPGGRASFTVTISRENFAGPVRLEAEGLPRGLRIELPDAPVDGDAAECVLLADANVEGAEARVTIAAKAAAKIDPMTLRVTIHPWLPEGGFVPGGPEVEIIGGRQFYKQVDRVLDGGLRVAFVLIPAASEDRTASAFYIAREEVRVGLFRRFAQAEPGVIVKSEDRPEVAAWEDALARFRSPDGDDLEALPVSNVSAVEAAHFARWLVGPRGGLPTVRQWETAAGWDLWNTGKLVGDWSEGSFRGAWTGSDAQTAPRIAIGLDRPRPVGTSPDDVSPYGCLDMSGNVAELTCTMARGERFTWRSPPDGLVHVVGGDYLRRKPILFADYAADEKSRRQPVREGRQHTGFRVIVSTAP